MRFVITGATSFIGLELTSYLLSEGHTIYTVCRSGSRDLAKIPSEAHIIFSEMTEYKGLQEKIDEADVFVNLAWAGTGHEGRNIADIQKDNIRYTIDAFYSAKKMGCKLFVEAGSQAEYGSTLDRQVEFASCYPFSEYGKAKLRVKEELFDLSEQMNVKYIHLRIFSMFGENDHPWTMIMSTISKMLNDEIVDLSSCAQNWNFIYIKDAVRLITGLCENAVEDQYFRHEVYNIASDDTRQLKEFVLSIKERVKSSSNLNFGAIATQNMVSLQPDISKIKNVLGAISFCPFEEVIDRIIEMNN